MLYSILLLIVLICTVINKSVLSATDNSENDQTSSAGPFSQLLGNSLYRWKVDEAQGVMQVEELPTDALLKGKTAVAIYFSASWCGPCRKVKLYQQDVLGISISTPVTMYRAPHSCIVLY